MSQHAIEHKLVEQAKGAAGIMNILRERGLGDDPDLVIDTVEGETDFLEAIDLALAEIDACNIIVSGCKTVEADIKTRRDRAAERGEKVKAAIEQALLIADVSEKIVRPTATLSMRKIKPSWVVDDESQIPAAFFKPQPPKLDKTLLSANDTSEIIAGCHVNNGAVSLTIRRK